MEHHLSSLNISYLLAIIALIYCTTTSTASTDPLSVRASFGDFCNKTVRCTARQFLTCLNETCQCLKPDMMTFDSEINSCVTIAGESCRYTVFANWTDEDQKSWTEEVKCLKNALCNSEGICDCDSQFYETSNGTCQPKGVYGAICKSDGQCREDLSIKCVDGTCHCDSKNNTSIYDYKREICVGLAGELCLGPEHSCVSNAHCEQIFRHAGYKNGQYFDGGYIFHCVCNPDTEGSPEGLCLVSHQGYCDATYPDSNCFPSLKCQDGKCVCPYEDYQYYDATLKRCSTLVGGPCGDSFSNSSLTPKSSWEAPCVANSSCTSAQSDELSECKCDTGFIVSADKRCDLGFGQSCPSGSLNCGKQHGLFCINGKCACKDGLQVYDFKSECRGLVGSICSMIEPWPLCVDGSHCVLSKPFSMHDGICRCRHGFALDRNSRTCIKMVEVDTVSKHLLSDSGEEKTN